jgi:hypothetical protein
MNDDARFQPHDPAELVAATFACPVCLHAPSAVRIPDAYGEPVARCVCGPCEAGWAVSLSGM